LGRQEDQLAKPTTAPSASATYAERRARLSAGPGERLRALRQARGWPIARLASTSGVSRAMISKVERGESSPTAVVLGKLSAALELSISELLDDQAEADSHAADGTSGEDATGLDTAVAARPRGGTVRRAAAIPQWRDPGTGYLRRQISPPRFPAAVTEVVLPAGARVPYPAGAYAFIDQLVWVLAGQLTLTDGVVVTRTATP
jgi:transcriptional regulator with XRE-family HTH domain